MDFLSETKNSIPKFSNIQLNNELSMIKSENQRLKIELEELRKENTYLKGNSESRTGEVMLDILSQLVNSGFFNKVQVQDAMFTVAKVNWEEMVLRNNASEPKLDIIAYHPSKQIDFRTILNRDSLIGMEVQDNDPIRIHFNKVFQTTSVTPNLEYLSGTVPKRAFGVGFTTITSVLRDNNGQVIGFFGKGNHLDIYEEINSLILRVGETMKHLAITKEEILKTQFIEDMRNFAKDLEDLTHLIQSIKQTLSDVEKVSDQSKILSFNASIESARAGVHGKGFAIVSEEIRKLSSKSKDSVERIATLIIKSFEDIKELGEVENHLTSILNRRVEIARAQGALIDEVDNYLKELEAINNHFVQSGYIRSSLNNSY